MAKNLPPSRKPVPTSSEDALEFMRMAEQRLKRARIGELSDEELEAELRRLAGGRPELEAYASRIMMDILKRPQPKSDRAGNQAPPKKSDR